LNINKPAGMTSHDVVNAVRRASGERRVGHAGTLDPMATGVLLVCLGSATRVTDYLMDGHKVYRADVRLGIATDTYDSQGQVTFQAPNLDVDRPAVEAALRRFRGPIRQVPPMYSAVKRDGRPLYELARRGVEVERQAREVEIYRLEITAWQPPIVQLEVECSKGTYVRALAHDLGQALAVGAHLAGLVRLASGRFSLSTAEPLDVVVDAFRQGYWMYLLHPPDEALLQYEALIVDGQAEVRLRQGQQIALEVGSWKLEVGNRKPEISPTSNLQRPFSNFQPVLRRAYNQQGEFIGLLRYDALTRLWQPYMIFPKVE
jgi:tRNA pseudouridine55 synthase